MAKHVVHDGLYVVRPYEVAPLKPGISARALVQTYRAARTCADLNPLLEVVAVTLRIASGRRQGNDIRCDRLRNLDTMYLRSPVKITSCEVSW